MSENGRPPAGPVPLRGLLISGGALVVALLAGAFFTDSVEADQDPDLVFGRHPGSELLLAYHKGWREWPATLVVGLERCSASTYMVGYTLSLPIGELPAFLPVIGAFIVICRGAAGFPRRTPLSMTGHLRAKEAELLAAYEVLASNPRGSQIRALQLIHAG